MVFSLFKKPAPTPVGAPPPMPASNAGAGRAPAAKPPGATPQASHPSGSPAAAARRSTRPAAAEPKKAAAAVADELGTAASLEDICVTIDQDPLEGEIDRAVMYFAAGQDEAAITSLEAALLSAPTTESAGLLRLWDLLFALYRLTGDRPRFENRALDFARAFEQSPPPWPLDGKDLPANALAGQRAAPGSQLVFKGELLASNASALDSIERATQRSPRISVDFSRLKQIDDGGAHRLARILDRARQQACTVILQGQAELQALCQQTRAAQPDMAGCWLLHLELLQRQGDINLFEEAAIDYAVRFEVSPPSWEPLLAAPPADASASDGLQSQPSQPSPQSLSNAYSLAGDLKQSRFDELATFASTHNPLIVDLSALRRLDFVSAGQLCNVLAKAQRNGRHIILHHPTPLIAELLRVVGIGHLAEIVTPRAPGAAQHRALSPPR